MTRGLILTGIVTVIAGTGCGTSDKAFFSQARTTTVSVPIPILVDYPAPGWKMFPAPTTAEGPGQVMAELPGRRSVVPRLLLKVKATTNSAYLPVVDYEKASNVKLSMLAKWLMLGRGASISNRNEYAAHTQVGVRYTDVIREWYPDMSPVEDELKKALPQLAEPSSLFPKSTKYYVISGCYMAKEVNFTVAKTNSLNIDLSASLTDLASLSGAVIRTNIASFSLVTSFPTRQRVLYLPLEISVEDIGLNGVVTLKLLNTKEGVLSPETTDFISERELQK